MTFEEFQCLVDEVVASELPDFIKEVLHDDNIPILVRDRPHPTFFDKASAGKVILGIFIGVPKSMHGNMFVIPTSPTRIEIFKDSFDKAVKPKNFRKVVIRAVVHEVAHYLGMSESEIRGLGY